MKQTCQIKASYGTLQAGRQQGRPATQSQQPSAAQACISGCSSAFKQPSAVQTCIGGCSTSQQRTEVVILTGRLSLVLGGASIWHLQVGLAAAAVLGGFCCVSRCRRGA